MPAAARLGDMSQIQADAHGCPACPHPGVGPITTGSPDVYVNKRPAARKDDKGLHAVCCNACKYDIVKGSPNVYVNGKPFARDTDKTKHCGGSGKIIQGSPNVMVNDGASASGLGSYIIAALKILLEEAMKAAKTEAEKASDSHGGKKPGKGGKDVSSDVKTDSKGSISRVGWNIQRALNGQEVEIQVEMKDPKGGLKLEIWARSADPTQDKSVSKLDASAAKSVKKKVKLDIPADAAGGNECHFYFVAKDDNGGMMKSEPIFVDRTPFRFSS